MVLKVFSNLNDSMILRSWLSWWKLVSVCCGTRWATVVRISQGKGRRICWGFGPHIIYRAWSKVTDTDLLHWSLTTTRISRCPRRKQFDEFIKILFHFSESVIVSVPTYLNLHPDGCVKFVLKYLPTLYAWISENFDEGEKRCSCVIRGWKVETG